MNFCFPVRKDYNYALWRHILTSLWTTANGDVKYHYTSWSSSSFCSSAESWFCWGGGGGGGGWFCCSCGFSLMLERGRMTSSTYNKMKSQKNKYFLSLSEELIYIFNSELMQPKEFQKDENMNQRNKYNPCNLNNFLRAQIAPDL